MRKLDLEAVVPPVAFTLDGAVVRILEAVRHELITGDKSYRVTLELAWRGKRSRRFFLNVKSWDDLVKKLLVEISKFKLAVMMGWTT